MKATSLFGGVQVFNIIISIIRSKLVALFLGQTGMGLMGLFSSATSILSSITNFGLGTSAVKNVAEASVSADDRRFHTVVTAFRRLVWITGVLGLVSCIALSPWLSELTFGNRDYTLAFIWLSASLLFTQLSNGELVLLQGLRRLKDLAKANVLGNFIGMLVSIPLYYYMGLDGIVPAMIATSFIIVAATWYFSRKVTVNKVAMSHSRVFREGKSMMKLGFMISVSGLLTLGVSYVVRVFISRYGGIEQVGLYNAGFAIINTYVGMVFTAMAADFYPRLSAVADDNEQSRQVINQQAEIGMLIIAPILIALMVFINTVVAILYSREFLAVSDMLYWAALGMFFKAASWPVGYLFLAKSKGKIFFWSELAANIYTLLFNVIGYYYWGLAGMGISFLVSYILVLLQVFLISKKIFRFSFYTGFVKIFLLQLCLAVAGFFAVNYLQYPYTYIAGLSLVAVSFAYSLKELDKRLSLVAILKRYTKRQQ